MFVRTEAYIKGTKHIIQHSESLDGLQSCILAAADVGSVYTNIGHTEASKSVKWALQGSELTFDYQKYFLKCLKCCLGNNYFWYSGNFQLQTMGVAMGARFSPSVANLFMACREAEEILVELPEQLICYKSYIDNLLIIWNGDQTSFDSRQKVHDKDELQFKEYEINLDHEH